MALLITLFQVTNQCNKNKSENRRFSDLFARQNYEIIFYFQPNNQRPHWFFISVFPNIFRIILLLFLDYLLPLCFLQEQSRLLFFLLKLLYRQKFQNYHKLYNCASETVWEAERSIVGGQVSGNISTLTWYMPLIWCGNWNMKSWAWA